MKKSVLIYLCVFFAGLMLYSCGPDDIKIQTEVKNILTIEAPTTSSTVHNGVATLQGTVETEEMKASLQEKVAAIDGVKSVVNEIQVVPPPKVPTADETLATAVTVALRDAKFGNVKVEVMNEEITLKGDLKKADQKKVMDIVKGFKSKKINDEIKIVK